jgi:SNF2 family DNA or RNA helicase
MMIGTIVCNFLEKTLIVVPPVLIDQWYVQIYRTTGHKSLIYHGENKKHITIEELKKAHIVLTTYAAITLTQNQISDRVTPMLYKIYWSRIIFDEAHHLRNENTKRSYCAKIIPAKIKWLVSGTPIQNKKQDFYSLCSIIGLTSEFYTDSTNLKTLTKSFILKRTKKQVGIIIPEMIQNTSVVAWTNKKEMELSEVIHAGLAFTNVSALKSRNLIKKRALTLMLRARQICIYPKLIAKKMNSIVGNFTSYQEAFNHSSKLDFVINKILERKDNNCGKLIFCHFREEIDEILLRLKARGMTNVASFDGRTKNNERFNILNKKKEALILQIQTGCEGLNLQENYSEIYFTSPHWNPAIEDQAVARCHRIGQKNKVYVERFEMSKFDPDKENTLEKNNNIENAEDTLTLDTYVKLIQEGKRNIACEIMNYENYENIT